MLTLFFFLSLLYTLKSSSKPYRSTTHFTHLWFAIGFTICQKSSPNQRFVNLTNDAAVSSKKGGAVREARKDSEQEERGEKEQDKAKDAG